MLKLSILLSVLGCSFLFSASSSSLILGKVNGEPLLLEDLNKENKDQTQEEKIKKAIQYRLIVQEAKKRGLERTPEIQSEIDKLLYKKFIEQERKSQKKQFSPSEAELSRFYEKYPLLRIRHLSLSKKTETEKQVASLATDEIQREIKKGTPFDQLCTQFSQDSSALFGGDSDFRGPHNFPEELYLKIRSLSRNQVSDPIELGATVHFFQWVEKKPFVSAPASYLQFLQSRFENQKERALLSELLTDLEKNAVIEPPSLKASLK
jgi:peptidyl-prolyl cis-trans isomerase C